MILPTAILCFNHGKLKSTWSGPTQTSGIDFIPWQWMGCFALPFCVVPRGRDSFGGPWANLRNIEDDFDVSLDQPVRKLSTKLVDVSHQKGCDNINIEYVRHVRHKRKSSNSYGRDVMTRPLIYLDLRRNEDQCTDSSRLHYFGQW